MIQQDVKIDKPYTYALDSERHKCDDFEIDASLTSLKWLQSLSCCSGLSTALQTPVVAPQPRLHRIGGGCAFSGENSHQTLLDQLPSVTQLDQAIKKQHNIDPNIDWTKCTETKPPHNYAMLIYMTIRDSESGKVTLHDIYTYIQEKFIFYRTINPSWKNSIRHNLTQHKYFKKTVRPDNEEIPCKGGFWTLDTSLHNIAEFSHGVWKLSKVKVKPATSKPSNGAINEKLAPILPKQHSKNINKSFKREKCSSVPYKPTKNTRGIKVGKTASPKSRRKLSSPPACIPSIPVPTNSSCSHIQLDKNGCSLQPLDTDWQIFDDDDYIFPGHKSFNKLYNEAINFGDTKTDSLTSCHKSQGIMNEARRKESGSALNTALEVNYDTPDGSVEENESVTTISAGADGCFALSNDMANFEPTMSESSNFDSLISSFEDISTDESICIKDISLEVVGVSMNLWPASEATTVGNSHLPTKGEKDLSAIMDEMEDTDEMKRWGIPLNWDL